MGYGDTLKIIEWNRKVSFKFSVDFFCGVVWGSFWVWEELSTSVNVRNGILIFRKNSTNSYSLVMSSVNQEGNFLEFMNIYDGNFFLGKKNYHFQWKKDMGLDEDKNVIGGNFRMEEKG